MVQEYNGYYRRLGFLINNIYTSNNKETYYLNEKIHTKIVNDIYIYIERENICVVCMVNEWKG